MRVKVSALVTGCVIGVSSVLAQLFLGVYPPAGYGVCLVGHPRDLVDWTVNHLFGTDFWVQPVSWEVPVLTGIGLLIGAFISAKQHKELKLREARDPISAFMLGFIVINFGLMIGFCPIRATVLTAYGSIIGLIGLVFIAIGILFGSEYVKRWG